MTTSNNKKKKAAYTESHNSSSKGGSSKSSGSSSKSSSSGSSSSSSSSSATSSQKSAGGSKTATRSVRDVMTPRVVAVTSVTFLPEAARIMKEEDVGALPVVQEDGTLLGIVTDRDITVRAVAAGLDIGRTQIAEIYTAEDLVTVSPETKLDVAEEVMAEHQVRRLPIVENGTKLVGMIALADIAREHGMMAGGDVLKDVVKPGGDHSQVNENIPEA